EGSLVSKAIRNNGLRVVPGDLQAEAELLIQKTLRDRAAKDPDAERHALTDAFASLGIQPSDLKAYLEHDLGQTTPQELADLRALYVALKEGETTWRAVLEARGTAPPEGAAPPQSKTEKLRQKLATKPDEKTAGPAAS
ncbi:MAG TPA: hypothetical protein VKS03_10105, partial [Thermoanaerobaculia bacterium]|nr:hypothetical protein [Thermoanaerobaculia bacterium]